MCHDPPSGGYNAELALRIHILEAARGQDALVIICRGGLAAGLAPRRAQQPRAKGAGLLQELLVAAVARGVADEASGGKALPRREVHAAARDGADADGVGQDRQHLAHCDAGRAFAELPVQPFLLPGQSNQKAQEGLVVVRVEGTIHLLGRGRVMLLCLRGSNVGFKQGPVKTSSCLMLMPQPAMHEP